MRYDVLPPDTHAQEISQLFEGALLSDGDPGYGGRTILVCFTNRCGSTVVCSALSRLGLAGLPNTFRNYEFLNANAVAASTEQHGHPTFEDYLRQCAEQHRGRAGAWTFKASPQQLNFLIESGLLTRMTNDLTVLWVHRSNLIAQAVSLVTAMHDRRWTSLHDGVEADEPAFDEGAILAAAKALGEQNALFRLLFDLHRINVTQLRYEDYADDEAGLGATLARRFGAVPDGARHSALPVQRQSNPHKAEWERRVREQALAVHADGQSDVRGRAAGRRFPLRPRK
jgi:LPS sulfotransferase NodH